MIKKMCKLYKEIGYAEIISSGLLSWSTVIGVFLRKDIRLDINHSIMSIIFALIGLPIFLVVIHYFFHFSDKLNSLKSEERQLSDRKVFFSILILLLICWLPYFMAYYPGIFAYDVGNQMRQITSAEYHTKHPLLHTLLIQIFYQFGGMMNSYTFGIACYCIFQMVLLASIISYTYLQLYHMNTGKIIRYSILGYYALFPVHAMLSISVTKDIIFSGLVLLFSVLYYKQIVKCKTGRKGYYLLTIVSVIMCLFRNNAIYAFILSGIINIFIFLRIKAKRNSLVRFWGFAIILYFIANAFLIKITDAQQGSIRESLSVPIQQISRTYNIHMNELNRDDKEEIEELIPDVLDYNSIIADPVKSSANVAGNEKSIIKLWGKLLFQYPFTYIEAFLYNSYGSWFIDDTSNAYVYDNPGETRRGYLISFCNSDYGVEHISHFRLLENLCERLFSYNDYQKLPFLRIIFAPALYFWIIFVIAINALGKKMKDVFTGLTFLLAYHFTIMCGPCCLVRYMYPLMITMPFVFGIYLHEIRINMEVS